MSTTFEIPRREFSYLPPIRVQIGDAYRDRSRQEQLRAAVEAHVAAQSPRADLREVDLSGGSLDGIDFRGADLSGADLCFADMREADLRKSNLRGAVMRGADMRGAVMLDANMRLAVLRETDLREADLRDAQLRSVDFIGALLTGALLPDGVPFVPDIDAAIYRAVTSGGGKLDMKAWHPCDTTHCRAGWAIHLAGEAGYALEERFRPLTAGALIYARSRPELPVPDFFTTNEAALADLRRGAEAAS